MAHAASLSHRWQRAHDLGGRCSFGPSPV